jgi:hypothetical protein
MQTLTTNGKVRAHLSSHACSGPRFGLSLLNPSPVSSPETISLARELDRLRELVATLPLSALEACFARNWLRSASQLLCSGEIGAARFQVAAVSHKLAGRYPAEGLGDRTGFALSQSRTLP